MEDTPCPTTPESPPERAPIARSQGDDARQKLVEIAVCGSCGSAAASDAIGDLGSTRCPGCQDHNWQASTFYNPQTLELISPHGEVLGVHRG